MVLLHYIEMFRLLNLDLELFRALNGYPGSIFITRVPVYSSIMYYLKEMRNKEAKENFPTFPFIRSTFFACLISSSVTSCCAASMSGDCRIKQDVFRTRCQFKHAFTATNTTNTQNIPGEVMIYIPLLKMLLTGSHVLEELLKEGMILDFKKLLSGRHDITQQRSTGSHYISLLYEIMYEDDMKTVIHAQEVMGLHYSNSIQQEVMR